MVKYENHCVSCDLPCLGDSCPKRRVPVTYCDKCGNECEEHFYSVDGEDLCEDCYNKFVMENINDILLEFREEIMDYLEVKEEET